MTEDSEPVRLLHKMRSEECTQSGVETRHLFSKTLGRWRAVDWRWRTPLSFVPLLATVVVGLFVLADLRMSAEAKWFDWLLALSVLIASLWYALADLRVLIRSHELGHSIGRVPITKGSLLRLTTSTVLTSVAMIPAFADLANGRPRAWQVVSASALFAATVLNLSEILAGLEFREGGVAIGLHVYPWDRIRDWEWRGNSNRTLRLYVHRSLGNLYMSTVSRRLGEDATGFVGQLLTERLGAPRNARDDLYRG